MPLFFICPEQHPNTRTVYIREGEGGYKNIGWYCPTCGQVFTLERYAVRLTTTGQRILEWRAGGQRS